MDDPVLASIKEMLDGLDSLSDECTIYVVPEKLRKVDGATYTPRVVSIGPLHHGNKAYQAMEAQKLKYLLTFLQKSNLTLESYVKLMRPWEKKVRDWYAEKIDLNSCDFVKMLVVDVSFTVELLLRSYFHQYRDKSDCLFHKPMMIHDVARDMILLENQLPFFLLESSLKFVYAHRRGQKPSILELSYGHVKKLFKLRRFPRSISSDKVMHLLDFIRYCFLPSPPQEGHTSSSTSSSFCKFSPTATTLHNSGIEFMVSTNCLLDIKFENGLLEIPRIQVDDLTKTLFQNLIAFEQCHYNDRVITQYITLISNLVSNAKDAELLIHHGVFESSGDDVSTFFNSVSKEALCDHNMYFFGLSQELHAYCRIPWHEWRAALKRDYFSSPWSFVSFIAAALVLFCSGVQAWCAVFS